MSFPRTIHSARFLAGLAFAVLAGVADAGSTKLFHNARIVTGDDRGSVVRGMLVRDGRVAALGEPSELERRADAQGAERIDLGGGIAFPGLQDGHVDLGALVFATRALDLSGARSLAEVIAIVEAEAKRQPKKGTWILGAGWNEGLWEDAHLPNHLLLSAHVPEHPVFLLRYDGRAALVNQAALELAGIAGPVQIDARKVAGRIVEDAEGHATGVLMDGAMEFVRGVMPPAPPAELEQGLLEVQERLLALGVSAVHDLGTRRELLLALRSLRARGELRLRVVCYLDGNAEFDPAAIQALVAGPSSDVLGVAGVRFLLDGTLELRGAALMDAYADAPGERGRLYFQDDEFARRLSAVVLLGLQPCLEAQGDRANRYALDLYERLKSAQDDVGPIRPRLESATLLSTKDWQRVFELGVSVSVQPLSLVDRRSVLEARIGRDRLHNAGAWNYLALDIGRPTLGSGAPARGFDPRGLFGFLATPIGSVAVAVDDGFLVTEPKPEDALSAYCSGPAWASRQENTRGVLKLGHAADLSVFAADPRQPGEKAFAGTAAKLVVIDGVVVWRQR